MSPSPKIGNKHQRICRLVQIIGLLQSRKIHNADSLATACQVSRRTIFRDLDMLRQAGVPFAFDELTQRYSIPDTYYLPPTSFTANEALAMLVLCQELGGEEGLPFYSAASSAAMKLESSLPAAMRDHLRDRSTAVTIELPSHNNLEGQSEIYHQLLSAITRRRIVTIRYSSFSEQETIVTKLSPFHLHFSRRSWYVIGRSAKHREVRTFNLGRIAELEISDETFEFPRSFSLDRYFGNAWHLIKEEPEYEVVIHFSPLVAGNVREVTWHRTQTTEQLPDGSLEFRVTVAGLGEISWWILGYGDQATVVQPPELRQKIASIAQRVAQLYDA